MNYTGYNGTSDYQNWIVTINYTLIKKFRTKQEAKDYIKLIDDIPNIVIWMELK